MASRTTLDPQADAGSLIPVSVIDIDVHPGLKSHDEIKQYFPKRWHHYHDYSIALPYRLDLINYGSRVETRPPNGTSAGSDPDLMEQQLLHEIGVDLAIMLYHSLGPLPHPDADAARNTAINEWQAATWLGEYNHHRRYRGSIRISPANPDAAIKEIIRWADHPYFVQVLAIAAYSPAYGHPSYERIWTTCAELGLPVAVHAAGDSLAAVQYTNPFGPPAFNFEWHSQNYPLRFGAHVASLICSGTFERLPELRFVMTEGGVGWAAALGGHLDRNWRLLKAEAPELTMAPSEYLRRQVFFSTQPVEDPKNPEALLQVYEYLGYENIMFSTDYPHWDADDPKRALPKMPAEQRQKIMFGNACELYGLPRFRETDALGAGGAAP